MTLLDFNAARARRDRIGEPITGPLAEEGLDWLGHVEDGFQINHSSVRHFVDYATWVGTHYEGFSACGAQDGRLFGNDTLPFCRRCWT